jgi:zinc protease
MRTFSAKLLLSLLPAALVLGGPGCAGGGFSPAPPELRGEPKMWVPQFTTRRLPNDLALHLNVDPRLPMVSVAVGIRGGSLLDPPAKAGLTRMMADALTARTERLSRLALAQAYDAVGGRIVTRVMSEGIVLQIDVLEDRAAGVIRLLAEILQRPVFDEEGLAWLRAQELAALDLMLGDPEAAGLQGLRQVVFGRGHPLALPAMGTRTSIGNISAADLRARYQQSVRPGNIALVVAGRFPAPEVEAAVREGFAGWKAEGPPLEDADRGPGVDAGPRKQIHYLARPGLAQTLILVGARGVPESHEHHYLLRMANSWVQASAGGWLRGIENLTYGVVGIHEVTARTHLYGMQVAVDASGTGSALRLLLDRYDARLVGSVDHQKVPILSTEGMPFFRIASRSAYVAGLHARDLPIHYWQRLRESLDEERGRGIDGVVFDYMRSERMQVVLVGDPQIIRDQVGPLGRGELRELALATE